MSDMKLRPDRDRLFKRIGNAPVLPIDLPRFKTTLLGIVLAAELSDIPPQDIVAALREVAKEIAP